MTWSSFLDDLASMGWEGVLPVLYLGIFPTFIAYGLWFRALARMPAAAAGAWLYASTLVAIVAGILVLGETLTPAGLLGGGIPTFPVAVNLVGGNMQETLYRNSADRLQQYVHAADISLQERRGVENTPVDVRLGGEVHDGPRTYFF